MNKLLVVYGILCLFSAAASAQSTNTKPNIIIILADDLGWSDLSCYGSKFYETPNLDELASKGMRFTQGYAASPVCSPTRASILTGKYPNRTGVTDWITGRQEGGKARFYEKLIGPETAFQIGWEEKTIGEYASEHSYKTFFAGKWHLGETDKYWPEYNGFPVNKGGWSKGSPTGRINDSTGGFFTPYKNPRLTDGPKGEYLTNRLATECLQFLDSNYRDPFLMVYSLYAVHNPLQAPDSLIRKYKAKQQQLAIDPSQRFAKDEPWMKNEQEWKRRLVQDHPVYAAMIENMDWNVGRILNKLKTLGIDDRTLVIFTSDNGGLSTAEGSPTTNAPLRAGKGWLYEGGIRVPLIIYWKGKISGAQVITTPVISNDIYTTVAALINAKYQPENVDGIDMLQLQAAGNQAPDRKLYWHYPHYSNQGGKPASAIRDGDYKLVYHYEDETIEMFNLAVDSAEKNNIVAAHQELALDMKEQLFNWLKKTRSAMPKNNPAFVKASLQP